MIRSHSATFDFNHKQGAQRVTYRTPEYNVPPWLTNRTGWPSWFSDPPENHTTVRGCWDFTLCQVSLNSIQRFQRRSRKCLSQLEAVRSSCFSDRPEIHKLDKGFWDLASCKVSLNSIQRVQRRSRDYFSQSKAGQPSCFSDRPEKHKLDRGRWDYASCQVSLNSI